MRKIQPLEGQCYCCAESNISVKECIQTKCDYTMCLKCYKKYYKKNTLCPACRNQVETSLIEIIVQPSLDVGEIDERREGEMDENRPNGVICTNCIPILRINNINYGCYCEINSQNILPRWCQRINCPRSKEFIIYSLHIIAFIILSIMVLTFCRIMYLITLNLLFPQLPSEAFIHNNWAWIIATCTLGIGCILVWLLAIYCLLMILFVILQWCFHKEEVRYT